MLARCPLCWPPMASLPEHPAGHGGPLVRHCLSGRVVALHDDIDLADGKHLVVLHGGTWQRASDIQATTSYLVVPDSQDVHDKHYFCDDPVELAHQLGVRLLNWKDFENLLSQQGCCCVPHKLGTTQLERKRKRAQEDEGAAMCVAVLGVKVPWLPRYKFDKIAA